MGLTFAASSLRFVRGTTWTDTVQLVDSVTKEPISLVGVTAVTMRVRSSIGSATVILELSLANNRLAITDAAEGLVGISVSAAATLAFPVKGHSKTKYFYDATLSRGGAPEVIEPGFKGKLSVYPQITRTLPEP